MLPALLSNFPAKRRNEDDTDLCPMPRISALYSVAYATDIDWMGTNITSVALRPEDILRYRWKMTRGN